GSIFRFESQGRSNFASQAVAYDAGNGFGNGAPVGSGWQAANANIGQANVSSLQSYHGSRILPLGKWQVATMGDELVCTKTKNGKVRWKKALPGKLEEAGGHLATPPLAVSEEALLICTLEGDLLVYEAKHGKLLFQRSIGVHVRAQPIVEQGIIYCTSMEGQLIAIQTHHPEWSGWSCWGGNSAHTNQRSSP
ncbi:MAG: PQQ-binding-like beta-propeller repeat protein, partial [Bacteroidota bacterium]